jgi:hypothetical protein
MDTLTYQTGIVSVNGTPLRGKYLSRSLAGNKHKANFVAADLCRGVSYLVEPSLEQAAAITGSKPWSVWWALRREEYRSAICAGELPLIPTRVKTTPAGPSIVPKLNGSAQLQLFEIDDAELTHIANLVGAERMLAAAIAAGH